MLRTLTTGLAILHLGPGLAFAVLAFGCEDPEPLLGAVCGRNQLATFAVITGVTWALLTALALALAARRRRQAA